MMLYSSSVELMLAFCILELAQPFRYLNILILSIIIFYIFGQKWFLDCYESAPVHQKNYVKMQ